MGKAADDTNWLDELAQTRDNEPDDLAGEHPADSEQTETDESQASAGAEQTESKDDDAGQADAQERAKQDEQRTVPLATMLEERNRLTSKIDLLEQRIAQQNDSLEKLRSLESDLRALKEQRDQVVEQAPDYLDDPKGYVDHTAKSVAQQLKELGDQTKKLSETQELTQKQQQQMAQVQQLATAMSTQEQEFAQKNKDYWDALEHYRNVRRQHMKLTFPQAQPHQIEQALQAEEFQTGAAVLQQGRNPAEYAYEMAKTLGYTRQKPEQEAEANAEMAANREKAQGLGSSGRSAGGDIEDLMSKSADEFDQAMKEMFG